MVIPTMAAAAGDSIFTRQARIPSYGIGGGWNDIHDTRMHGRDARTRPVISTPVSIHLPADEGAEPGEVRHAVSARVEGYSGSYTASLPER